ncbi:MAG: 3-hydroxyacyl-CoA dehydrogenase family protein [Marinilabiliales bacterium]|nr:MAG: 3-hydroxyacyl-CoA dehydrogenase family protein [Marinilabiliales bacterium]
MAETKIEPIEQYGLSKKDRPKTLFSKVGIVGCGSVGQAIARIISCRGIEVVFIELSEELIRQAIDSISCQLDRMIQRWGMTPGEKRSIMSRIKGTMDYGELSDCDLVIEAILSKSRDSSVGMRKEVFRKIEKHVSPETIIATNSTTLVITELSAELEHNERCVSLHFSTTSPDSGILEVARGLHTSDEAYEKVLTFGKLLSKVVIPVEESPGLISVRLLVVLINEACQILSENVAAKEDIDLTLSSSLDTKQGPFEMADRIGLDRVLRYMDNLYSEFGDIKYKANPIIKRLVRANQLGRKTGRGFYGYDENGNRIKT